MGGLHAVNAAERGRHTDGATLVAAQRHVHLARRDQGGAAGRRPAGGVAVAVRVVHGTGGAGVAAAGKAELLADRLAEDGAARVQNALDHRRVQVGHVAFERGRPVHHRHAGHADIVLDGDGLALELARAGPLDGGFHVPGAVAVLLALWPAPRQPRVSHRRHHVRHLVDRVVGGKARQQALQMGTQLRVAHGEAELLGGVAELVQGGSFNGVRAHVHGLLSSCRPTRQSSRCCASSPAAPPALPGPFAGSGFGRKATK